MNNENLTSDIDELTKSIDELFSAKNYQDAGKIVDKISLLAVKEYYRVGEKIQSYRQRLQDPSLQDRVLREILEDNLYKLTEQFRLLDDIQKYSSTIQSSGIFPTDVPQE